MYRFLPILFLLPVSIPLQAQVSEPPNIIYIMSDDHDADAISAYNASLLHTPNLDRLAFGGLRFTHCFVGNSICAPARATVLTGMHSHKNGILDNRTSFNGSQVTLPKLLRQAGYQTAMIGKWHLRSLPTGFDYWKILPGQGLYYQPRLIEMTNDTITVPGYATDILTGDAIGWLRSARDTAKPFFLMLHEKAPHRNWVPSVKWLEQFYQRHIPEPPYLYADSTGKGTAWRIQKMSILPDMRLCTDLKIDPDSLAGMPEYTPDAADVRSYRVTMNRIPEPDRSRLKAMYASRARILKEQRPSGKHLLAWKYQWYMQDYLACVASVDENIGRLLNFLDSSRLAENTIVMYTSDQGFYLGENGWFDKRFMYDVSMQTPLLVRWPGHIRAGGVTDELVQNIDFAPSILDMAGVPVPSFMQGISLKKLMKGAQDTLTRKSLYYHYYEYPWDHNVLPHLGIRQKRYKLIDFYTVGEFELYDLQNDPGEQHNLAGEEKYQALLKEMKEELLRQRIKYDDH